MSDSGIYTIWPIIQQYLEIFSGCKGDGTQAIKAWPTLGSGRWERLPEQSLLENKIGDGAIGRFRLVGPRYVTQKV